MDYEHAKKNFVFNLSDKHTRLREGVFASVEVPGRVPKVLAVADI